MAVELDISDLAAHEVVHEMFRYKKVSALDLKAVD